MKVIVIGFVLGLALGYGRTVVFEPEIVKESARWILALQTGFAFSALALFLTNYLELRRRVLKKAKEGNPNG